MSEMASIDVKRSTVVGELLEYRCGGHRPFVGDSGPEAANVILHDLSGFLFVLENATRDAEAASEAFYSSCGSRTSSLMGTPAEAMEGLFSSLRVLVSLATFLSEAN